MAEVLAVKIDLGGTRLTFVNVYIPPASSCSRNYAPDFDTLQEDHEDQMVLGDFNAHYPSWFSRTGDDTAAARGEALDRAVNSSQLAVANQDLPNNSLPRANPPCQISPFWAAISSQMWHGPPLPHPWVRPSPSPVTPCPHRGKHIPLRTSARLTGRDLLKSQKGYSPVPLYQSPALLMKKSSGVSSTTLEDTISLAVMLGTIAAVSPEVVRPLISEIDQRRIDYSLKPAIKVLDRDIQWLIRQEAQDQWRSMLESSDSATNPSCASWAARGLIRVILHQIYQSPSMEKPNPVQRRLHEPSFSTTCFVQQDRTIRRLMKDHHRHHRVDPSYRPFDNRGVAASIRKAGYTTAQGPDGLTMLHLHPLGAHGLAFLTELFNLSIAWINIPAIWKNHNPDFKGRKASRPWPIITPH